MRQRSTVLLLAAFALAVIVARWWSSTTDTAPTAVGIRRNGSSGAPVSETVAGPQRSSAAPATDPPLFAKSHLHVIEAPDPGTTRAVERIRFWRHHASTGNTYASCKFAFESTECAWRNSSVAPWARRRLQTMRTAEGEVHGEDCEGVTEADTHGRFDILLGAAERGDSSSALMFAMGVGLNGMGFSPVPSELRRYRAEAPRLAWQAFAAGDSDAAVLLWRSYNRVQTDFLFLAAAIDPDPVKAHALDLLMDDLVPDFIVGTAAEAGLSKEQAAQAEAMRAEWRATAFAQGKPPRYGMEIERMFEPEKRAVDLCAPDPR